MKTTTTELENNQVRIDIEVAEDELSASLDAAARDISRSVNLKGFRKGKVPRKVLEQQIGKAPILEEAVRHAIPRHLADAIESEDLDMIGQPQVADISSAVGEPLKFSATIAVRPTVELPDLDEVEVTLEMAVEPSETEIDQEIENLRERFATPETVSRAAAEGDYCLINVDAHHNADEIAEFSRQDYLYEVGSGHLVDELDSELTGARAGDIVKFNAEVAPDAPVHGGDELSFGVLVKEVKAKVLPDLDDDWVQEASEFDSVDELRDELVSSLRDYKLAQAREETQDKAIDALVEATGITIPDSLVDEELDLRQQQLTSQIAQAGMSLDDFLEHQGEDIEAFRARLEPAARSSVFASILLRAIADTFELEVTAAEIDEQVRAFAEQAGSSVASVRKELAESGRIATLAANLERSKALKHLIESVAVTDADGAGIDLTPEESEDAESGDRDTNVETDGSDDVVADSADAGEGDGRPYDEASAAGDDAGESSDSPAGSD